MTEHNMNPHNSSFNDRRAMLAGIGGLAAGAILTGRAQAGPLDPPPGPIAPTGKPLNEVEPRIAISSTNTPGDADNMFKITQPGSYYLTSNITGVSGKNGIMIVASGVTIDLNGFALIGVPGSLDGISASLFENPSELSVHNGTIRDWTSRGISFRDANVQYGTITDIRAIGNGDDGIAVSTDSVVLRCLAGENGGAGIRANVSATISLCIVTGNTQSGIQTGYGPIITECTARSNGASGIVTSGAARVDRCIASLNAGSGISVTLASTVTGCHAGSNDGIGIYGGDRANILDCTAFTNGIVGISVPLEGMIASCKCSNNAAAGISAGPDSCLLNNTCDGNGDSGILVTGSDCRIEDNHCTDNVIGLLIDSAGNFIIRNTCAGNTVVNWSISPDNYYGPIINRSGINTAAVNGNFAPSTLTSTDPHANFTY